MAYRGRLIHHLLAELRQLDTNVTATSGGYDANWKTPTVSYPGGVRTKGTAYKDPIRLRCQVEQVQEAGQQRSQTGDVPDSRIVLVFHYVDLLAVSLVGPDGRAMIRPNDKLVALYTKAGALEKTFTPELFAVEVLDGGHGLGGRRNLALVTFADRPQGVT